MGEMCKLLNTRAKRLLNAGSIKLRDIVPKETLKTIVGEMSIYYIYICDTNVPIPMTPFKKSNPRKQHKPKIIDVSLKVLNI